MRPTGHFLFRARPLIAAALAGLLASFLAAAPLRAEEPDPPAKMAKFASEFELLRKFPPAIMNPMAEAPKLDANGFVGFHARDGRWYEAGMQRGGCWALIAAVVADNAENAEDKWRSVETTFAHQLDDGGFESLQKPDGTRAPTFDDRVETAYFYLQELGHALLVIQESPMEPRFHDRIEELKPRIARACAFINSGYDGIIVKVGHTANRLLIAGKAFGLCGVLLNDESLKSTSRRLIGEALKRRDADGVFVERGGRDSSYNSVALLMGQVLALHLPDARFDAAVPRAMAWQLARIKPTGEVEVSGNTRTGVGRETGMSGHAKNVNYHEVALTLCYYGLSYNEPSALALAELVDAWPNRGK